MFSPLPDRTLVQTSNNPGTSWVIWMKKTLSGMKFRKFPSVSLYSNTTESPLRSTNMKLARTL